MVGDSLARSSLPIPTHGRLKPINAFFETLNSWPLPVQLVVVMGFTYVAATPLVHVVISWVYRGIDPLVYDVRPSRPVTITILPPVG